jgi:hypothetical protein
MTVSLLPMFGGVVIFVFTALLVGNFINWHQLFSFHPHFWIKVGSKSVSSNTLYSVI